MNDWEELERLSDEIEQLMLQGESYDVIRPKNERYFEILQDIRNDELSEEVWWAAILVENEKVPPNIFNSFEWVNTCVEQLKDPLVMPHLAETYPSNNDWKKLDLALTENVFDDDWRGVETLNNYSEFLSGEDDEFFYRENGVYFNPVEVLISQIRRGAMPKPELLLSLAKAFDLYFISNGALSLEDVFFGSKSRVGNYAKQRNESFKGIDFKMFEHSIRRNECETIEGLAEVFIKQAMSEEEEESLRLEDVDAFLRKYRRWKKRQGIAKSQRT